MKTTAKIALLMMLTLLLAPALAPAQEKKPEEKKEDKTYHGFVEFGGRGYWGDVYGRPDLPFKPALGTSKYNEYRDIRDGFFLRHANIHFDDILGTSSYLSAQTEKSIYRDQTYLVTFGRYDKFKLQFRFDEIPHTYSNTTRTLFAENVPGVFTLPVILRSNLQAIASSNTLPSTIQSSIVPTFPMYLPRTLRKAGTISFAYNFTPNWSIDVGYFREHEGGHRPIGAIFNSSPSAATSGGYGVELPEPIDYFTDRVRAATEFGGSDPERNWGVQVGYLGSFFQNQIGSMTFDNPFRTTDCVAPTNCTSATQGPATGRTDLYPDNKAHYLSFSGATSLGKYVRLMASITPGWLRQNDPFIPYTSNSILLAQTTALPSTSLNGSKRTLAMNYTAVAKPIKNFQVKAAFRDYDYSNDTPVRTFTPVEGDFAAPTTEDNERRATSYNKKNVEVTGNYFFGKRSSFKAGYEGEWMDRSRRDVAHSLENTFLTAVDFVPRKEILFRLGYRHSMRTPDAYLDEETLDVSGGIPAEQPNHRRFDEAKRLRDRVDALAQFTPFDRLSFSAYASTLQDDYNQRGGTNSATPLNFVAGATHPYFLYGVLKDLNWDYGFDADLSVTNNVSLFAEYSHELSHKRMVSRQRTPATGAANVALPPDCSVTNRSCDSANNDWESTAHELADIYALGSDFYLGKKATFTTYWSLSAVTGNVNSRPLGNTALTTGPDKFILTGTNAAVPYPETTSRNHEVAAIFRYKLNKNITPKIEYRYSQFDNKDYQTSAMTPYMGCVSPLPPSAAVPGCPSLVVGTPSPFYPYFVVGDPSAARYLFLGRDEPSYHVHYLAGTLEFRF